MATALNDDDDLPRSAGRATVTLSACAGALPMPASRLSDSEGGLACQ